MSDPVNRYKSVLISVVELLKEQALEYAGTVEGQNPYQALKELMLQCECLDVPLADIGLEGFDLDQVLRKPPRKAT